MLTGSKLVNDFIILTEPYNPPVHNIFTVLQDDKIYIYIYQYI